ncbi:MAG TPA: acyl-CoA dehydrogenase family protein [Gammaproteobacteria bacterium]|nr:acyl-CoA dehydrogenase family protein [Gammaproteobacteria bacterium]
MLLDEPHKLIRDTARRFAREVLAPGASVRDRSGEFPRAEIRRLGELGFMGITIPESYDGASLDFLALAVALEEIAAGEAAVATIMSGHNSVGCMPVLQYGTEEQKQRFLKPMARGELLSAFCLTEPEGGSDAGNLRTSARRQGDSYVLNGTKQFITSGSTAGIAIIFARTEPNAGPRGLTAFLVPTDLPGYRVVRKEEKMGQAASDTCQIAFDDVSVPISLRLGAEGDGYRIALSNLEGGRIGIAAQCVGVAAAALGEAVRYARERKTFGKPIIEHQAVAFRLAQMATLLESARQLVYHAASLRDAGIGCIREACMAKLHASEAAERVCSDAIQTLGGYGYLKDFPLERFYRDIRVAKIYEGTNDIQCMVIARHLD